MAKVLKISIIIPTLNESEKLPALLSWLREHEQNSILFEIIISDGGSSDNTIKIAKERNTKVVIAAIAQRAAQLNLGASMASGDTLYFLHADSIPPKNFLNLIKQNIELGFQLGCFRLKFDNKHWFLKLNAWFTRFHYTPFHYGDQSLFITKELFNEIKGFDESLFLMEDQEILVRAKRKAKFVVLPDYIITSARKYVANGIFMLQFTFYWIYLLYQLGFSQSKLISLYKRWIH